MFTISDGRVHDDAVKQLHGSVTHEQVRAELTFAPFVSSVSCTRKAGGNLKSIALFLVAPFIGLLFAVTLFVIGTAMLVWVAAKSLMEKKQTA